LTKNTEFTLGKLGKPHGLKGYMYLNHDPFFRKHDLTGLTVFVEEEKYVIHDFKRHLKKMLLCLTIVNFLNMKMENWS